MIQFMTGSCSGGVLFLGVHCSPVRVLAWELLLTQIHGAGNKIWQIALSWL